MEVKSLKKYIHINQWAIKANKKLKENNPVITVKTYKDNFYGHEVEIDGPSKLIYSPQKPLGCGAVCYLTTFSIVKIDGKIIN